MATNRDNERKNFIVITGTPAHMIRKWTHWVHWTIYTDNQGSREIWLPLHVIQKIHKVNDKITSPRHGYLPEHVQIQQWDIKWPQPSSNHPRILQSRLQQVKNHIWAICKSLHSYHEQHQANNSSRNCTAPIKRTRRILFHVAIHWKTDQHTYIWIAIKITEQVVQRVDELGTKGEHPYITNGYLIFEWSPQIPIMDQADSELEN